MSTLWLIVLLPLLMAALGLSPRTARWLPWTAAGLMLAQVPLVLWLCAPTLSGARPAWGGFALDGMGAAFAVITTLVATAAVVQAALLLPAERMGAEAVPERRLCFFYTLSGLFLTAMYGVVLAQHLGYLWIAMEATTLMSAPLVCYHRHRRSLEATWKYLLLCSVGIAFALFGTVLFYAAQHASGGDGSMLLRDLLARAGTLDPRLLRFGFIFCLLGYGTKAGLFPLHNWLPDAHSEAPSPASAMLSGALLNCALVAIWRLSQVMVAAGQADLVRQLLVPAGALTVLAAGILLVRQQDLKRMWAYHSVEHMGLLVLAIGLNSGPIFILHAFNHSVVKVALFLLTGNLLHLYGSKKLVKVRGVLNAAPLWGLVLMGAGFAIVGSPPFGTFVSEWLLLRDAMAAREMLAGAVVILGLTLTFIALSSHVGPLLFGATPSALRATPARSWAIVPALLLMLSLGAGLAVSPPVMAAITTLAHGGGAR